MSSKSDPAAQVMVGQVARRGLVLQMTDTSTFYMLRRTGPVNCLVFIL